MPTLFDIFAQPPSLPLPRRARADVDGQATVEFALILPLLCLMLFGAIQFGDTFLKFQEVSAAASEGARKAIVSRNDPAHDATITSTVKNAAPNLSPSLIGVAVSSTWLPGSTVSVKVTYPYTISLIGMTVTNGNLTTTRTMRVEQ